MLTKYMYFQMDHIHTKKSCVVPLFGQFGIEVPDIESEDWSMK